MDTASLLFMAEQAVKPIMDDKGSSYVWAVVFTGLSVVFLGLIILILFVWLMGKVFTIGKNKNKQPVKPQEAAPVQAAKPAPSAKPAASSASADEDEVIAVISAAVAMMGQAEGKTYRLRSVKAAGTGGRSSGSAWAMAGLQNNTRPF